MPSSIVIQAVFLSAGFAVSLGVAVTLCLILILGHSSSGKKENKDVPTPVPGVSLLSIFPFFKRRYDFLCWGFKVTGENIFKFKLLNNIVIVVSGENARNSFFNAKSLDLTEGFKILSGAIPMIKGVTSDLQTRQISQIHKRLANVQRNASLSALIPLMLEDSRKIMETWGSSNRFDPFDNVYELLFQTTVRSLSCREISDNRGLVKRLKILYDLLDTGTTPASVLLPWFPTRAMIQKLWTTKEIHDIITRAIQEREASGISRDDTLQMLLDFGDDRLLIIGFVMGLLIAGARATGTTASWMTTFLAGHPIWRAKAAAEVELLLARNCFLPNAASLSSRLSTIPLEAWELETPVMDAIIRETTRVAQPHAAMRRNLGPDLYIDSKRIPTGAYVIYPFSDVHLNPSIYTDPWRFDPGRREAARSTSFEYVGWGGGKTVCLGTRLAKLELKLTTAMTLLGFRHSVVDSDGNEIKTLPIPNWNDVLLCRPPKGSFYLKHERIPGML